MASGKRSGASVRIRIDAFVDLAGLGPGTYNLRVQVDPSEEFGVGDRDARASWQSPSNEREETVRDRWRARQGRATTRWIIPPWRGSERRSCAPCGRRSRRKTGSVRCGSSSGAIRASRAPWIEEELARGAGSEGASVTSAGVIPTPAIAYVTPAMAFDAGIVISASHNPFEDNGIKVFSGKGEKFTETLEREVEAIVARTRLVGARRRPRRASITPTSSTSTWRTRGSRFPIRAACAARGSRSTRRTARRRRWRRGCSRIWASSCSC